MDERLEKDKPCQDFIASVKRQRRRPRWDMVKRRMLLVVGWQREYDTDEPWLYSAEAWDDVWREIRKYVA
jgi:hypothetical protein